jgi:glucokinase
VVIGTGISSGVVVDGGTMLNYRFGTAGETGHVIVDPSSTSRCSSAGCRGCLEAIVAGPAIRRAAMEAVDAGRSAVLAQRFSEAGEATAEAVGEAALAGDPTAMEILERAGFSLGVGLVSLMHIFSPDAIIVGGGVASAGELLLAPARRALADIGAPFFRRHLKTVRQAALGPEAGVIGAATLIFEADQLE